MSQASRWRLGREPRGYILFLMLVFIPLLGMASMLAIDRTVGELLSSANQVRDKRAFFRADGSATICHRELINRVQVALPTRLRTASGINAIATYVPNDPIGLLVDYAYLTGASSGGPLIRPTDNPNTPTDESRTEASLPLAYTVSNTAYSCTLTVVSRGAPVNTGSLLSPQYLFRYRYAVDGIAEEGGVTRQVNLQGTFSVVVQQDSFARYALFSNSQVDGATGNPVWFTSRTSFSGPVHTNGQFNFLGNPSGRFTALADSFSTTARYYNNGSIMTLDAGSNGLIDVPDFGGGFQRGSDNIPMPAPTDADGQRDAALGGASRPNLDGVYVGAQNGLATGGIYVKGDASIRLGVGGPGIAQYTISVKNQTYTVKVHPTTKLIQIGSGPLSNYDFNGMLFVDGLVQSLEGTLQRDSQLSIAATKDIQITGHLAYENFTAGSPPSAEGATNILGLISWNNVRITDAAPNDINIHATVMAPTGEFRVDHYTDIQRGYRGTATVLGGVIESTYGPFGNFAANTGYARNFVYDTRLGRGMAPPFFPTIGRVISTVAGINDRPNWQQTN